MEENEQKVPEIISHVTTEDCLCIEGDRKHTKITQQTLKDCKTLETLTNDNSDDNFAEAFISEIIYELVERATTPMLSEQRTKLPKQASELTNVLKLALTPKQSIPSTVAEDISYFYNQKVANTMQQFCKIIT